MLTHTIRALTLLALVIVAHTLRPFSPNNVTVFASQAVTSVASLLPAKTLERWQNFGSLAAFVTGNPAPFTNRFANPAENAVIARLDNLGPSKLAKQLAETNQKVRISNRLERKTALQTRRHTNIGGVPMPYIPDLESSLIATPSLMAFPHAGTVEGIQLPSRAGKALRDLEVFGIQQQFNNFEQDDESLSENFSWLLETVVHKPKSATIPSLDLRMLTPLNRSNSNAQACPQPARNSKGIVSTKGGQSC